ncbi:hypothetical protein [Lysobacter enzymogenes]|uniref:Uncharacterized protein n=1 Tax=Lysobacter enzymogenes TaxID=69 RepID=A0A0S2DBV8_LYSEN|nr:hypothetical protein [Lysobacter enzymogenes]ALN55987.1 hypothetical protein GLE_0629 [Lysobacter enzymogenes]QCW24932.1 hypothetical protein FE772_03855 [Lysobacter enzymogenes]QQQ00604.1 hypothetical protein JHW41_21400 [Lysobacter enzymogenes]UZW60049.1 hypothetical protein BV903_022705 [Lysobacter enzymogenes]
MKKQGTMQARTLAALAAFVFGSAAAMSAGANSYDCQLCWDNYHRCKNTPEFCDGQLQECLLRGDGKYPCPPA